MGITFWLVPSPETAREIQQIAKFRPAASEYSLENSYPNFDTHITLASLPPSPIFSLETLRAAIPSATSPITCDFASLEKGSHYFRSVYLAIQPSVELTQLHGRIHSTLGIEPKTPSYPHVSLCYITDQDATRGERERYYNGLKETKKVVETGGGVSLSVDGTHSFSNFQAHEIWIAKCDGPVETWEILDKIAFVK